VETLDVQAVATVTMKDMAGAVSELPPYEVNNFFVMVAGQMSNPRDIMACARRLRAHCVERYGPQLPIT